MFFADEVVLVEGLSDRIFFEPVLERHSKSAATGVVEVLSVGGKGLFVAYVELLAACQIPYSIIADLDYLEEIGSNEIKELFALDDGEIKKDVIDNVKSQDGATLVARIDQALKDNDWKDAQDLWTYIKARHRKLKAHLTEDENAKMASFILNKRKDRIFVLGKGSLEDYLPVGYRTKDLEKLIQFLGESNFWNRLPTDGQAELSEIANLILQNNPAP